MKLKELKNKIIPILREAGGEIVYEKPWSIESPRLDQRLIAKVKDEN